MWDSAKIHTHQDVVEFLDGKGVAYMTTGVVGFMAVPVESFFAQCRRHFNLDFEERARQLKGKTGSNGRLLRVVDIVGQVVAESCLKVSPDTIRKVFPSQLANLAFFIVR